MASKDKAPQIIDQFRFEWSLVNKALDAGVSRVVEEIEKETGRRIPIEDVLMMLGDALISRMRDSNDPDLLLDLVQNALKRFRGQDDEDE